MSRSFPMLLSVLALFSLPRGFSQNNPLTRDARADYKIVRDYTIRAAVKTPKEIYAFKPSPVVRTFGQLIAHIADDQYNLCAPVRRETRHAAYAEIEKTLSAKADLVAALQKAFEYCDGAYDSVDDASASQIVKFGKTERPKLSMLNWNTWHTWEHYGNIVVYMRLKGLVPPSGEKNR